MGRLTEEQIAELKGQHGMGLVLEAFDDPDCPNDDDQLIEFVLKPPTSVAVKRFLDERNEGKLAASTVIQNFVDPHVVYPSRDAFKAIVDKKLTGVRVSLSVTLQQMAGAQGSRESKKL